MGRPSHDPTAMSRRNVEALAGYGVPEVDIAGVIGIDPKTLRRHYATELKFGHVKANAKVAENLFRKATGDGREAVIAAIFWMKTRARWKETTVQEHSAPDDMRVIFRTVYEAAPTNADALDLTAAAPGQSPRLLSRVKQQN